MGQHVGQGSQKESTLLLPVGMWARFQKGLGLFFMKVDVLAWSIEFH